MITTTAAIITTIVTSATGRTARAADMITMGTMITTAMEIMRVMTKRRGLTSVMTMIMITMAKGNTTPNMRNMYASR